MEMRETLALARQLATPSSSEKALVELASKIILTRINTTLKKRFIKAKAICGGSLAKRTWLPNNTDIDIFVQFKYRPYKNRSDELADILEPIIAESFSPYSRLHGSRDYYRVHYGNYTIEIIPVLKIKKHAKAKNITDVSPLHVDWTHKKSKKTKLANEIRLAKLFLKGAGVYGAESYIRGFSGHVTEILVTKYKSFLRLARASQKWTPKVYIDVERHYYTKNRAIRKLNKAKLDSPILVIDPVQPERNAAAALNSEKFRKLISQFKKFIISPDLKFFKEKTITIEELKSRCRNRTLILLQAFPLHDKRDVAGAKLLKQFEHITRELKENDFKVFGKGWQWKGLDYSALFWFYLDTKQLPEKKKHLGPLKNASEDRVAGFIKKHGKDVRRDSKHLYVMLSRKYRQPETLIKSLLHEEEFTNTKII